MNFNEFCRQCNVNYDREEFFYFMCGVDAGSPQPRMLKAWQDWYHTFAQINDDARDLADTQADALGVLF